MKRCANCVKPATHNYMSTLYCDAHLPRFLRSRAGLSTSVRPVVQEVPSEAPVWVAPTGEAVATFVDEAPEVAEVVEEVIEEPAEEAVEEEPVVRTAPRPTPKKAKYTPKAVTPSE